MDTLRGRIELARLKTFSSRQGVATCFVLDCSWRNWRSKMRLGWVAADAGAVDWRGLHKLLIIFWKVPCIQQCRSWKQCWHKAEDWLVVTQFPSIHDNTFRIALSPFTSSSPRPSPPHPHLSVLQCSLALFLWKFGEFTTFHSFSVFLFFSPKTGQIMGV